MRRMQVAAHLTRPAICRATADLDSAVVGMLEPGTLVEIREEQTLPTHKLRYHVVQPIDGWASAHCFETSIAQRQEGGDTPRIWTDVSEGPVLVHYDGPVVTITLNQPENNNALTPEINDTLAALAEMLHARRGELRLVFLRATGRTFCAGGDPKVFQESQSMVEQAHTMSIDERAAFDSAYKAKTLAFAQWLARLNTVPQVLVGLVQGNVFGGGNGLCACCDLVCAVKNARFQLSEVKLGVIPAVISPFVIAAMGPRNARRYFLTAEPMSAQTATEAGLCSRVVDDVAGLDAFAKTIVKAITLAAPQAVAEAKELVAAIVGKDPSDPCVQEETSARLGRIQVGDEARAGMAALLSRQPPPWAKEPLRVPS